MRTAARARFPAIAPANKYGAKREYVLEADRWFDSKAEAKRARELCLMRHAGLIRDLAFQVRYPLIVNGHKVCTYVADFVYADVMAGGIVIEDVKGVRTDAYRIKCALMFAIHGWTINEVEA